MRMIRKNLCWWALILSDVVVVQTVGAFVVGQGHASRQQHHNINPPRLLASLPHSEEEWEISPSQGELEEPNDNNRRQLLSIPTKTTASLAALATTADPALATNPKSRTDGYAIQKPESQWRSELSDMQYYVLRRGGTENPNYSILESEDRPGTFVCAACGTELFDSKQKFHSGTGWPSFARGLPGVEVEAVNPITANLVGAELRCETCGGHLGDVFNDGYLFVGTPAFTSGKRYCIDGAALIFKPDEEGQADVSGDTMKPQELPSWFNPPQINAQ